MEGIWRRREEPLQASSSHWLPAYNWLQQQHRESDLWMEIEFPPLHKMKLDILWN